MISALDEHLADYLRLRRALGFKLERHGQILPQLIAYLQAHGASTITSELAIAWARSATGARPRSWAARLAAARQFAAYLQTIDPQTEVPPAGVFAVRYQRPAPYLWSEADIRRLVEAAGTLTPPLKAASMQTLFGLLAVTGMRVGEVVAIDRGDVDLTTGVICVREHVAKLERARLLPLHETTVEALAGYARTRDRLCRTPRSTRFFLGARGGMLDKNRVARAMRQLTTELGLRTETAHPRSHDLRHSFAVRCLVDCQRAGEPSTRGSRRCRPTSDTSRQRTPTGI